MLMNSSNYFINTQFIKYISACFNLMFVTNSNQSNVIALWCNFDSKNSFCKTVCTCMVMQIKLSPTVGVLYEPAFEPFPKKKDKFPKNAGGGDGNAWN